MAWLRDHFNWRVAIVRVIANGLAIALVLVVVPDIWADADRPVLATLWVGFLYGVLNALVRPFLNIMLVPFLLQTYGFVMIVANIVIFVLLAWSSGLIVVESAWAAILGGILLSIVSWGLEGVLGLTRPVLPDDLDEATA